MPEPSIQDPDLTLSDLMTAWPQTVQVFMRHRMLCVGCHISRFHTLKEVCAIYNLDEAAFRREMSQAINAPHSAAPE